jgi:UDP-glucose 4-epimerase
VSDAVVTGGAGAIGSRLVRRLIDQGRTVHVVDDFSSGHEWLLPKSHRLFLRGGAVEDGVLDMVGPGDGADVFHLAAHFANQNSVDHPVEDLLVNGLGTLRTLQWAEQVKAKRVVFSSAGCAVGHEDTPYQIHKRLGETYCRYFSDRVSTAVMRFHNSYGPGEVPGKYRNVIPNWVWAAMHHEPLTLYGDGTDRRDFVFVEDVVDELLAAIPSPTPIEVGTGVTVCTKDLLDMVLALTESRSYVVRAPSRRWDHSGRTAEVDKRARVPLEEGLRTTIRWFKDNYDRIRASVDQCAS